MEMHTVAIAPAQWSGDALIWICEAGEGTWQPPAALAALGAEGLIAEIATESDFQGKAGSTLVIRLGGAIRKLILVGLGKDPQGEACRRAAAMGVRTAKKERCQTLGLTFPGWEGAIQTFAEGAWLGLHQDRRFKSDRDDQAPTVTRLDLLGSDDPLPLQRAEKIASGVIFARELVNAPPNVLDPVTFAEAIQDLAKEYGLECRVLEADECDRRKMGAFLGVAKASDLPAKFVHLIYRPEVAPRRKLAIVGKGLTFDSGGYNIKVAGSGIEAMKMDMGGAAATFGAAKAIAQLKPDVEVHFISAITENMISGHGLHPGDILTASNGKTIEINNTDAEGRLTLADALVYADQLGVEAIVDLATLTGACVIALGDDIAGMWGDDQVSTALLQAAETSGEKLWVMPLEERYAEGIKSPIADLKNTGPRAGGAITAALFLKNFVEKTPWVHIDIAGPVWSDKDNGLNGPGGTGFGVRTLVEWVMQ